jgi:3-oxoacyl-[acyl-carrier protein] reductase
MAYPIDLSGQVAVVTGGARGIGSATCRLLAEAGADIVLDDIKALSVAQPTLDHIRSLGREAVFVRADVAFPKQVERIVETAIEAYGRIDILVNNAGVVEDWDRTLAVNTNGPYLCARAVLPHMLERGRGRIVNISSTAAMSGSTGAPAYVASKGALFSLTRFLAREYAPKGILVNGIMPAVIQTDMLMARYKTEEALLEHYIPQLPVRRVGRPIDIARIVLFLCSELSSYISGEVIVADGGRLWGT